MPEPRLSAIRRVREDGEVPIDELLPIPGHPTAGPSTLIRWAIRGKRGHKLDAIHRGSRWYSSPAALARFLAAVEEAAA